MIRTFEQVRLLEWLLEEGGAQPLILSENRNVMTTLWEGENGKAMLFAMNLYSSPQSTAITVYPGTEKQRDLGQIDLGAMEVKTILL